MERSEVCFDETLLKGESRCSLFSTCLKVTANFYVWLSDVQADSAQSTSVSAACLLTNEPWDSGCFTALLDQHWSQIQTWVFPTLKSFFLWNVECYWWLCYIMLSYYTMLLWQHYILYVVIDFQLLFLLIDSYYIVDVLQFVCIWS